MNQQHTGRPLNFSRRSFLGTAAVQSGKCTARAIAHRPAVSGGRP